jgi:hypothetical protein
MFDQYGARRTSVGICSTFRQLGTPTNIRAGRIEGSYQPNICLDPAKCIQLLFVHRIANAAQNRPRTLLICRRSNSDEIGQMVCFQNINSMLKEVTENLAAFRYDQRRSKIQEFANEATLYTLVYQKEIEAHLGTVSSQMTKTAVFDSVGILVGIQNFCAVCA